MTGLSGTGEPTLIFSHIYTLMALFLQNMQTHHYFATDTPLSA